MTREPLSPADRIRWAIDQSGLGLERIADEIGCTHSALSQWQTGKTNVANVKVGLLMAFCQVTGANITWLLTGDGPRLLTYSKGTTEAPLMAMARHIVQDLSPEVAATAYRVLTALDSKPQAKPATPAN
jgi:transcriptional regulator with XRE-family HTH domain